MDYTTLIAKVQDIVEEVFTDSTLQLFAQQAEKRIYNMVQFPALRKNQTGTLTVSNRFLTLPDDFNFMHSIAVVQGSGRYEYLINKDVNFIREAYPNPTAVATPKHYALFDGDSVIVGPTPDIAYTVQIHYGFYPESIVTAGTTWLGDVFDNALLNAMLVEASRFMKEEADVVALYDKMFKEDILILKTLSDGKLRQDSYRSGQARVSVG